MTRDILAGMRMGTLLTTAEDAASDDAAAVVGEGTVAGAWQEAILCTCSPNRLCARCRARLGL